MGGEQEQVDQRTTQSTDDTEAFIFMKNRKKSYYNGNILFTKLSD